MTIGEALKATRQELRLTQEEMSAGIVSESFYSKAERGLHKIDADTLVKILIAHHINVYEFFAKIINQQNENSPYFNLLSKIVWAQNNKDLNTLKRIRKEVENDKWGGKVPTAIKIKLEEAYVWITHSAEDASPFIRRQVKKILSNEQMNSNYCNALSQAVILLDMDEAYLMTKKTFDWFIKNKMTDTFNLQSIASLAVNFLNCCYHKKAKKKYFEFAIDFLQSMPADPCVGTQRIIGEYYNALLHNDVASQKTIIGILKKTGYYTIIQDTVSEDLK